MKLHLLLPAVLGLVVAPSAFADAPSATAPAAAAPAPAATTPAPAAVAPAAAAVAPAAEATPVVAPAKAADGYTPKMWPEDKTWPKTGTAITLPILDATVRLPAGSPNTWQLLPELPGDGFDSHTTRLARVAGGPPVVVVIRFAATTFSSILDPCGDFWDDVKDVKHFDRTDAWPPRFETKMGRQGNTYIACLSIKGDKRNAYSNFRTETSTTITVGRSFHEGQTHGAAFAVSYDGDLKSADFATVAADLEAIAGAVQERHGDAGNSVVEAYAAFSTLSGVDHTKFGGTGDTLYGLKLRADTTPYRSWPFSVMTDMSGWGGAGSGFLMDMKLGLGLGYFVGDLIGISVHGTGGMEGGLSAKSNIPLMFTYGFSATAAVNLTKYFRVRAWLQPSKIGGKIQAKDNQLAVSSFQTGKAVGGMDESTIGAQVEWSIGGRSAANGGSEGGGATFYAGLERRSQFGVDMTGLFIGFGGATGSWKAPAIDPKASPQKDMGFFMK